MHKAAVLATQAEEAKQAKLVRQNQQEEERLAQLEVKKLRDAATSTQQQALDQLTIANDALRQHGAKACMDYEDRVRGDVRRDREHEEALEKAVCSSAAQACAD